MGFIRRVVTGHDKEGKAVVISDGLTTERDPDPLRPGRRSCEIWKTTAMPAPITRNEPDPVAGPRDFVPPMGTKIRIAEIPPETDAIRNLTPEQAHKVLPSSTFERGGRHPMMHRTESIDYAVVLEGEITMLLDEVDVQLKAGDVVIQRGTNHAWSNRSDKRVRMLYVLVDGRFEPELAALFKTGSGH